MKDKDKKYYLKAFIRFEEGDDNLFEYYKPQMNYIIERAKIMALNAMENIKRMAQSEMRSGNINSAFGLLNKRYDTLLLEQYYNLCVENYIPRNIIEMFKGWLPVYR